MSPHVCEILYKLYLESDRLETTCDIAGWDQQAARDGPRGMKTVAVVGASSHQHKFGNQAVRGFLRQGYTV